MIHAIVADTRRLRVFEATPDKAPTEVAVFVNLTAGRHERDLVSDRPGRVINSASGMHQAYQPRTPASDHALRRWLRSLGRPLQQLLDARGNVSLVLFASPRLLPKLLQCLPDTIRQRVSEQAPLDLAQQPAAMLKRRIQPVLRKAAANLSMPAVTYRTTTAKRARHRVLL